jgi:hypothetical protein
MPRGFRPCRICRPEVLRAGDRLDYLEKRARRLERRPHVSLWASGMLKPGKDEYEPCRWYAALNWSPDGEHGAQHTLSRHHRYQKALSLAMREGRRLNLPVIKHSNTEMVIMWLPTRPSNAKQKELARSLQSGKVRSLFGDGVIVM